MELGKDVFELISSLVPIINVDLLIKDESGNTLLSWRDDTHTGTGWHLPGGIIRLKETAIERVEKVSLEEIQTLVNYSKEPVGIFEIIEKNKTIRSHCVSLLYKCFLSSSYVLPNNTKEELYSGYLRWFKKCPDDFLIYHNVYRKYIDDTSC